MYNRMRCVARIKIEIHEIEIHDDPIANSASCWPTAAPLTAGASEL